jgi:hypothetical protein
MIDAVEASATVGDGKGELTGESFKCAGKSTIKGGRRGVRARPSSFSFSECSFAFAMSIGQMPESLNDSSKTVRAGDGGGWLSCLDLIELTGERIVELAELVREPMVSSRRSSVRPLSIRLLLFNFRVSDGKRVPIREVTPERGESPERCFFAAWLVTRLESENMLSGK